jgi:pimeloyl-ACP methyl ester carboxylesterase
MASQERSLLLEGKNIQLFEGGTGSPLLYLHGAGTFWWMPVHDLLARSFQLYLPVHPGFGNSQGGDEIETIEDVVFHYIALLDLLGIAKVSVIGLSLGGWIAAELALRRPDRVERLVLVNAAGLRVEGAPTAEFFMATPAQLRPLLFAQPDSDLAKSLIPDVPPPERLEMALRGREAAARLLWNPHFAQRKLRSRLHRIQTPTLVIWGKQDGLLPLAHGQAFAAGIPNARLVILDGCAHVPPFEQPESFVATVLPFLQGKQ